MACSLQSWSSLPRLRVALHRQLPPPSLLLLLLFLLFLLLSQLLLLWWTRLVPPAARSGQPALLSQVSVLPLMLRLSLKLHPLLLMLPLHP